MKEKFIDLRQKCWSIKRHCEIFGFDGGSVEQIVEEADMVISKFDNMSILDMVRFFKVFLKMRIYLF